MLEVAVQAQLGDLGLDASFTAPPGVTALFGPSGAGKTSLIRAIAGLSDAASGRIALDGEVLLDERTCVPPHRRGIGYVFQDARLFPHMTVRQNLTYGGRHDFDRLVDVLGLAPLLERRPAGLSGGEKQRVALGRALMRRPQAVLMDEPLAALDGPRKAEVLPYLAMLGADAAVPIIYVSHALPEIAQLADRIIILDHGKIARSGRLDDVLADPSAASYFSKRDRGAMLCCKVHRSEEGVTVLASPVGKVIVPGDVGGVGDTVRLLVPAHDVILSRTSLKGQSALNVLPATIASILELANGNLAIVVAAGEGRLWAEVTPLSVRNLGLGVGQEIHAVFKATAIGLG